MSDQRTLIRLFRQSVMQFPDNPFMWEKKGDEYVADTYKVAEPIVETTAAGLLDLGLKHGDRVALLSEGRNDWIYCELAILYCGAMDVPLSVKLKHSTELEFRFSHSQSRFAVVSGGQLDKVLKIKKDLPDLEKIITLDETQVDDPDLITISELRRRGEEFLKTRRGELEQRITSVRESDAANICYTSGTTADPKGIILTHRNYTANIEQAAALFEIPEHYTSLLILPWDHCFAHTAGIYTLMSKGASMSSVVTGKNIIETTKNIAVNLKETKPSFLLSVPALSSNFKKGIEKEVKAKGAKVWKLFQTALKIAYAYQGDGYRDDRWHGNRLMSPLYHLFDNLILKKVRTGFGERLEFFVGGGALLDLEYQRFFTAIGIPVYQGYGLTEASPIISANCPGAQKMGSSGRLVPNLEISIRNEDHEELPPGQPGEIVIKGENVMKGYWRNQKATDETIKNGWLYTGDMGYMDKDGYLMVLGRYKSLLISDDGEKFSPEGIEESLIGGSPYIDQVMLYNNQNPYTSAFIVPNYAVLQSYLQDKGLSKKTEEGQRAAIQLYVDLLNTYRTDSHLKKIFPGKWIPSTFAILGSPFTEENGFINSTMKMVRWKIAEFYQERIDYMYTAEGKDAFNYQNRTIISRLGEEF
ncbi:AMP-binding protein [candidate division KSB1 bacterium]|nr:AMP-binding protein [candidate division KSB1 bacterium]